MKARFQLFALAAFGLSVVGSGQPAAVDVATLIRALKSGIEKKTLEEKRLYIAVLFQDRQLKPGIEAFNDLLDKRKPDPVLYLMFYKALRGTDDDRAIDAMRVITKKHLAHAFVFFERGTRFVNAGEYGMGGQAHFKRAIEFDPFYAPPYLEIARRDSSQDEIVNHAAAVLVLTDRGNAMAAAAYKILAERAEVPGGGQAKPMIQALADGIGKRPLPEKRLFVAALLNDKQYSRGAEVYDELFPTPDPGPVFQLAHYKLLQKSGQDAKAKAVLDQLGKALPENPRILYEKGRWYTRAGEYEPKGRLFFEKAVDVDPFFAPPYLELARRAPDREAVIRNVTNVLALTEPGSDLAAEALKVLAERGKLGAVK
jgi:tetratricopeptide (TPR) repeat protein